MPVYHILNGDNLYAQLPTDILKPHDFTIIMRECLIEGDVSCPSIKSEVWLDDFLSLRAAFITRRYPGFSVDLYHEKAASEIRRVGVIGDGAEINLWFEDDLFCQANLWFLLHLLFVGKGRQDIFLVRPSVGHEYSFVTMSKAEFIEAYKSKISIAPYHLAMFSALWQVYAGGNLEKMIAIAEELQSSYPFMRPAVLAHCDRFPQGADALGRPERAILQIISDLGTTDFSLIFQEFTKREAIYGFGDIQLRFLYESLVEKSSSILSNLKKG